MSAEKFDKMLSELPSLIEEINKQIESGELTPEQKEVSEQIKFKFSELLPFMQLLKALNKQ